jgi:hypothetical protein
MLVKIKETSEIKELNYTDIKSGIDCTNDLIGNQGALSDGQFLCDDESEADYITSEENFDWWENIIKKYEKSDKMYEEFIDGIEEVTGEEKDEAIRLLWNECNCDFEDIPDAIISYIEKEQRAEKK